MKRHQSAVGKNWASIIVLMLLGCDGHSKRAPALDRLENTSKASIGRCENDTSRSCSITLEERAGVTTCYRGTQTCADEVWGECEHGAVLTLQRRSLLEPSSQHFLAYSSSPQDCVDNPCDPQCQLYNETPDSVLDAVADDPEYDWTAGTQGSIPRGLLDKGIVEPCTTASDCQFNTYCSAPDAGSCAHAVCSEGNALESDCNACATVICEANATCCKGQEKNTCSHDPCATGDALDSACNPCVAQICKTPEFSSCCASSGTWTKACVDAVANTCGRSCACVTGQSVPGANSCYVAVADKQKWSLARTECRSKAADWDLAIVDNATENAALYAKFGKGLWLGMSEKAKSTWCWLDAAAGDSDCWSGGSSPYTAFPSSGIPGDSSTKLDCALMGSSGSWGAAGCTSTQQSYLCEGPKQMQASPSVSRWDDSCVDMVATHCGAVCDETDPNSAGGVCMPWYLGMQKSATTCDGIDLSVGIPCVVCDDANDCAGQIPICNHGSKTADAGIPLVTYPGNSAHLQAPTCSPDLTDKSIETCYTSAPIPPGKCINLTKADLAACPTLLKKGGNRELMVNPLGHAKHVDECLCADNWSIYSGGECGAPVCAGGSSEATLVRPPVDIIFIVDNSTSMTEEISAVQARINEDFATIIGKSGIDYRVIMFSRYGNVNTPIGDGCPSNWLECTECPICVSGELGGGGLACSNPNELYVPTTNPRRFFHYSTDVDSSNSWCHLLATYNLSDANEAGAPTRDSTWQVQAENGWSQWLRKNAFKVFVEITDDQVNCSEGDYTFRDKDTVAGGKTAAAAFDAALLELDPQFGTAAKRNYVWHSIAGMISVSDTDPISLKECTGATRSGTGYQGLSLLTGGIRYPICSYSNFDDVFNAIAAGVVEQSTASCTFALPQNQTDYDPQNVAVTYSSLKAGDGNEENTALAMVTSVDNCKPNSWYYDNREEPTTLTLCPTICDEVQADATARVALEFGCPGAVEETTYTQTYEGDCSPASNKMSLWLDLGYDAYVPSDATLSFRGRVANSANDLAKLAATEWVDLGDGVSGTCAAGQACAIDIFSKLGETKSLSRYFELEITLTPNSKNQSPVLNDFQVTYSCMDYL